MNTNINEKYINIKIMEWHENISEKYRLFKIYHFGGFVSNVLFLKNWDSNLSSEFENILLSQKMYNH